MIVLFCELRIFMQHFTISSLRIVANFVIILIFTIYEYFSQRLKKKKNDLARSDLQRFANYEYLCDDLRFTKIF